MHLVHKLFRTIDSVFSLFFIIFVWILKVIWKKSTFVFFVNVIYRKELLEILFSKSFKKAWNALTSNEKNTKETQSTPDLLNFSKIHINIFPFDSSVLNHSNRKDFGFFNFTEKHSNALITVFQTSFGTFKNTEILLLWICNIFWAQDRPSLVTFHMNAVFLIPSGGVKIYVT